MGTRTIWLTCGTYPASDPRKGIQDAAYAQWKALGCYVVRQRGDTPEDQRARYIDALTVQTSGFVTISDDDCLLQPLSRKALHKDPVYKWDAYVQQVFDRFPEIGYLGPWLTPNDGAPEPREIHPMSVVGGIRFIRQGVLDPNDMLPATGKGYDKQIAIMLAERGWKAAKLPRLRCLHAGWGLSTVAENVSWLRA